VDITGLQTLEEVIGEMHKRGVHVLLASANPRVHADMEKAGILDLVGRNHVFDHFIDAVERARQLAAA